MRILVLTKRQYMGMDLLDDRFGRFRELPLGLARWGHDVAGVALSYRPRHEGVLNDADTTGNSAVTWHSINLGSLIKPRLARFAALTLDIAKAFRPDLIWACSDAFHAIFGTWLANKLGTPCVVDLYDNFESFKATWMPGVLPLFKRAVRRAHGITCVSRTLADHVAHGYAYDGRTLILTNSTRADLFLPRDRTQCRKELGLPEGALIVGTAGALEKSRGVNTLFRAFASLGKKYPTLRLALAGPRRRFGSLPTGPMVHDFGTLRLDKVPMLLNALDVAVVCNRNSAFGRYCFPQKAYEIIACRVPMIAAGVGSMKDLLAEYPLCLYEPQSTASLAAALERQLKEKTVVNIAAPSWTDSAKLLEAFFHDLLEPSAKTTRVIPVAPAFE